MHFRKPHLDARWATWSRLFALLHEKGVSTPETPSCPKQHVTLPSENIGRAPAGMKDLYWLGDKPTLPLHALSGIHRSLRILLVLQRYLGGKVHPETRGLGFVCVEMAGPSFGRVLRGFVALEQPSTLTAGASELLKGPLQRYATHLPGVPTFDKVGSLIARVAILIWARGQARPPLPATHELHIGGRVA